ncbi:uncharacterized protein OCT59_023507 [Rhizophagus irregularis]|uniref:uncharacterized protein n=1 Tax=Rhizophagus irregularis TaxID=588596 RepID=UPI0033164E30|nr:hypothetical protein OCT59_023507 [Rhizophagus irregularis]
MFTIFPLIRTLLARIDDEAYFTLYDYYFNLQVCDLPLESYTCEMYYNDVRISNNNYLDIAYEEVIFR